MASSSSLGTSGVGLAAGTAARTGRRNIQHARDKAARSLLDGSNHLNNVLSHPEMMVSHTIKVIPQRRRQSAAYNSQVQRVKQSSNSHANVGDSGVQPYMTSSRPISDSR